MGFLKMDNFIKNLKKSKVQKNNFKLIKNLRMNLLASIKEVSKIIIKNNNLRILNNLLCILIK